MRTPFTNGFPFCTVLGLLVWVQAPSAKAQAPTELPCEAYAGLTITGQVGTVYSVEYVTDLTDTTAAATWRCLEFLRLPAQPYLWMDKLAPLTANRFYRAVAMASPANMVFIAPGTFRMGSPTNEVDRVDREGPQTEVMITRGFWIGKYELTQGDYLALMGRNPSFFTTNDANGHPIAQDLRRPVDSVSWFDATNYCYALTQQERAAGRIAINSVYRLPTEAEWEYACRGWTSTRFSFGDDPGYTNLTDYAWHGANSAGMTHPVGQKMPNPWGLYDMHGNAWEWCHDWFADNLPGGIVIDPSGPATGTYRAFRGGIWDFNPSQCRSAYRNNRDPHGKYIHIGFRIVLAASPNP